MTTEQSKTELATTELATWLDAILAGDSSLEPPQDSEALAVVWAMRPDLAPPAKLSIESVLNRVSVGPFMERVESSERMEGEEESASHEKVDIEALDTVEDDFVTALFSEARTQKSASPSVSLDDVFARIESGPFGTSTAGVSERGEQTEVSPPATEKPDEATSSSLLSETERSSANNNRWWNARWLAGGLAAALVLLTLVPSEFEAPVSEDSIFAPREEMEMEEALPADEIHYSRRPIEPRPIEPRVPKFEEQAKRTVEKPVSPKRSAAPSKKSPLDTIAQQAPTESFERGTDKSERSDVLVVPSDSLNQPTTTKSTTEATAESTVESKPSTPAIQSGVVGGATASDFDQGLSSGALQLDALTEGKVLEDASSVGAKSTMMSLDITPPTDPAPSFAEPKMDEMEDLVEEEPMPLSEYDAEEKEENDEKILLEQTLAVPQVEEVVVTDRMEALTLSKESKRRQFGKAKGQRAKKAPMAAESAPMSMSADDVVSGYAYTSDEDDFAQNLPAVLTVTQRQEVAPPTTVQQVLDLCEPNKPTEALDILWVAHQSRTPAEQIQLLEQSSVYSNGDPRYLKRNWLKLAQLYRKNGNVSQAEQYEQRASRLP